MQHPAGAVHAQDAHGRLVDVLVDLGKDVLVDAAEILNGKVAHVGVIDHRPYHATISRPTDRVGPVIHQLAPGTVGKALARDRLREMLSEGPTEGVSI